jgi:YD repeat-containing protein
VKRAVVDRRGLRTEFDADAADRPVAQREYDVSGALAFTQSTTYDDAARTETARDRRGIATVRERDGLGRIESVTRGTAPDRQVTLSEYDEDGNLVEVTDPNGHVSASTYDGANRRISDTRGVGAPEETTTRYKLDKVGNRVEQSNPRTGTFVSHDSFDDLNRLVAQRGPAGERDFPRLRRDGQPALREAAAGRRSARARPGGGPFGGGCARRGLRRRVCHAA